MANAANILKVSNIVLAHGAPQKLVVVSALGGITDQLLACGQLAADGNEDYTSLLRQIEQRHLDTVRQLLPVNNQSSCLSAVKQLCNELEDVCEGVFRLQELSARSRDRIASYGELLSSKILAGYWQAMGLQHQWLDSRQLIVTNAQFGNATVDFDATQQKLNQLVQPGASFLAVAPGFIAATPQGLTTTLGRGGSDYTASIYAALLNAQALEIWTDVSGMMTADPRWVPAARPIPSISYQEAMELSHFGAKVIYPPTIQPAMAKLIPVWVKNTFEPGHSGTLITHQVPENRHLVRGISSMNHIALLSLEGSGMVGIPGFSKRLFEALAQQKINVILITQASSEHSICVGVNAADAAAARQAVHQAFETELAQGKVEPLAIEEGLAIVALVGDRMKSHPGISGHMFSALGRNGINIRAIAQGSSERNISAVIAAADVKKALNVLHEAFFEEVKKQLNLFIAGVGNVGKRLLAQLAQQQAYLSNHLGIQLRVIGAANSRHMMFNDEDGLPLEAIPQLLQQGLPSSPTLFAQHMIQRNLRNSVFVDVTASHEVAAVYEEVLCKSISVVACNKIAASSTYGHYQRLKALAREYNAAFLFETNVGAGLPVIGTLNDLVKSGDQVHRMEAVLSGTLNFVFNNYDGTVPFWQVVKQAQDEGYTEPDPRLDLGGTDVMRKIMILAREAGYAIEMDQIENQPFLPAECFEGSVEDFYQALQRHEAHFLHLYEQAAAQQCKLKFVASFNQGKASVGLQHIPPQHDLYHLYGKDNIVLFYTQRYPEQPMVIKGAGAGADVTAAGVFADIMRISSQ